eukprot:2088894-Pyramimonas_sp.AAC.1
MVMRPSIRALLNAISGSRVAVSSASVHARVRLSIVISTRRSSLSFVVSTLATNMILCSNIRADVTIDTMLHIPDTTTISSIIIIPLNTRAKKGGPQETRTRERSAEGNRIKQATQSLKRTGKDASWEQPHILARPADPPQPMYLVEISVSYTHLTLPTILLV